MNEGVFHIIILITELKFSRFLSIKENKSPINILSGYNGYLFIPELPFPHMKQHADVLKET
jgi:hypothetical protein